MTNLEGKIEKGDIVHLAISMVNSMKVDGGNLTCTIVDKIIHKKNAPSYYITCKGSVIKDIIQHHLLTKVLKATPKLIGLTNIEETWTSQQCVSTCEAITNMSLVGSQGLVKCSCKGPSDTNHCKCKKANKTFSSHYHRNNHLCTNY